jgi:hypothetical protein
MPTPHKLTLVPYLQRWDAATRTLAVRVLVAPTSNPLEPLLPAPPGVPAFADAALAFEVHISDTVGALPQRSLVDQRVVLPNPASGAETFASPHAREVFATIKAELGIPDSRAADTFAAHERGSRQLHKYLPTTYRQAFPFVQPRTSLAVVDDTYHCLMKCPPEPSPTPPTVIGWGEAIAYALRRPRLAEALGLIVELTVPVDDEPRLADGGWLWVDLTKASDYADEATTPGFLRSFATRVPELPATEDRPVFTPVVFPVSDDAAAAATLGNFDKIFVESVRFDDGFAKIVHARQPVSADPLDEEGVGPPIARDEGVFLGWDDEDVLEGQNRALGAPPDGEDPILAPRGILGYRVDVRQEGDATWTSLSNVKASLHVGVDLGGALEERWSEVYPAEHSGQLWLPAWFLRWRGGSLVIDSTEEQRLMGVPKGEPEPDVPVGADAALRYGHRYEFRVRLADTTGGGPSSDAAPTRIGESPVARLHMRRHRPPSLVEVDTPAPGPDGRLASVRLQRPRLGYPEAVFAGGDPARASLLAQLEVNDEGAPADARPPSVPDPDTDFLEVRVLIRPPTFDPEAGADGFVEWYRTTRPFPGDPTQSLDLTLAWLDAADYRDVNVSPQLGAEGSVTGPLSLLTARDLRLEVRALGHRDLSYFASEQSRRGPAEYIDLHAVAEEPAEADLLRPLSPADTLRSVFLQPDFIGEEAEAHAVVAQNEPSPALLGRLAAVADLAADGPMLLGQPGERIALGCAGLAHHAAPDASSIELTDPSELAGQWINVVQVVIDRDWTWRGADSPTVQVSRNVSLPDAPGATVTTSVVGTIELMNAVNVQARQQSDHTSTRVVFIDALPPRLDPDGLPHEMAVTYTVRLRLEGGGSVRQTVATLLPVVSPPAQVPRVVAAGLALTPYERAADYASSAPRSRHLWLEFAEPLADRRDAYFVRPLTATPDPMLLPQTEPAADPAVLETGPLDPELVRVITPGQVQDLAGLSTMQRMTPSVDSDRHFLVPLPPNTHPDSPELFSFFTYEIRIGHDRGRNDDPLWSTAQGRFGEPLVLEGVQHPAPGLPCAVTTEALGAVRVRAPYATPYLGLRRLLPQQPNTELWAVLYARVVQADASTQRNIPIDRRSLARAHEPSVTSTRLFLEGEVHWSGDEVRSALEIAGLPPDAPVSVLAVELMPEPNGSFADPLGGDLGQVRILRTSPLAAVERDCCTP